MSSVEGSDEASKQLYFDTNRTHVEFTTEHICLGIQFTALPIDVFIIRQIITNTMPQVFDLFTFHESRARQIKTRKVSMTIISASYNHDVTLFAIVLDVIIYTILGASIKQLL